MGQAGHLMTQDVTYAVKSGRSSSGDPSYGAQSTVKARWEKKAKLVISADGNEEAAEGRLVSETEIPLLSRVWLPGDNTSEINESKKPINVGKAQTPDGYTLYEVWL
jgi:hypothetical protein